MSALDDFNGKLDPEGRFREHDGTLKVVFATKGGMRFPGRLHFRNGLCARAEMESGGDWANPDNSPIDGIRFLFDFGGAKLHEVAINQGRVLNLGETREPWSKRDFLLNFRVARNFFVHSPRVEADSATVDTAAISHTLARAAIWLTPKSVAGFNAADFPELGLDRQRELQTAVRDFLGIANEVPPNEPAMPEQYGNASVAFAKVLDILEPYLPVSDEARQVETALKTVEFPSWVVDWNYELASDSDGVAAVWVDVFVDEQAVPYAQLGRAASELTSKVRQALYSQQVSRWPYLRLRTVREYKVG